MTIRQFIQRFGKPLAIILLTACIFATLRGSLKDAAKLHPQDYRMLAAAMALFVVHYLIQAAGWHFILRALGQPIALRDSVRMYFLSLIARWMPGRIWYTATRLYIGKQLGLSVTAVGFAMVLELIYILIGGVIVTVAFAGSVLRGVLSSHNGQLALYAGVAVIVIGGTLIIRPSTLTSLSRLGFVRKVMRKIAGEELTDENRPTMSTASSLSLILYFTLFWMYSGLMFGVLSSAFVPMNPERWTACLPAFAGSWLIGFFSIVTPAGIGVREFAMTVMLRGSMGQAAAIVLSIASRLAMMFTELLLAGIAFVFLRGQLGEMPFAAARNGAASAPIDTLPDANELLAEADPETPDPVGV